MALVSKVQKCQLLSFVALVLLLFLTASYFKTKIDQLSVGCSSKEARTDLPIFTKIAGWLKTFFTHFVDNPVTDSTDDGPDLAFCISVPWEFLRLYQKAIGDRAAVASVGLPAECQPAALSLLQTLRMWLSQQLAWSHGNPCDRYYYAVFVDPLWEITPFM
ncbi:hypothetical protein BaRGS_00030712, partial [Batillaria attramentaria]